MHSQLELLLEIQDLKAQAVSLREEGVRAMESDVFAMPVQEAVERLEDKVEELAGRLRPGVRQRYRQLAGSGDRVVAPVLQGICYGCFVAVPTAVASEAERNEMLTFCQNCGRFLYHVS